MVLLYRLAYFLQSEESMKVKVIIWLK